MQKLGLNTLDCLITASRDKAVAYLQSEPKNKMSMRTEKGSDFLCPFYYGKPGEELVDVALKHIKEGYTLLLYPYLDYVDSFCYGALGLPEDGSIIAEYVMEPGIVRWLDAHPHKESYILMPGTFQNIHAEPLVNEVIKEVKEILYYDQPPCIVEWSYYKMSVGNRHRKIIYWEIRDYA